jgi:hypothetical protein
MRNITFLLFASLLAGCQPTSKTPQRVDLLPPTPPINSAIPSSGPSASSNVSPPSSLLAAMEPFDEKNPPIYRSRIIRLADDKQDDALAILGGKNFCPATPEILNRLLDGREPDTQRMLEVQASAALAYAKRRRDEAANPFFGDARRWMNAEADAHEALARYTSKLSPNLHAYVIEAKVYSEYTGGFYISLKGDELFVEHGSLGGPPSPVSLAILVFVEKEVKRVTVKAGTAE